MLRTAVQRGERLAREGAGAGGKDQVLVRHRIRRRNVSRHLWHHHQQPDEDARAEGARDVVVQRGEDRRGLGKDRKESQRQVFVLQQRRVEQRRRSNSCKNVLT